MGRRERCPGGHLTSAFRPKTKSAWGQGSGIDQGPTWGHHPRALPSCPLYPEFTVHTHPARLPGLHVGVFIRRCEGLTGRVA